MHNRIRLLRKEHGLTMKELGEHVGLTESAISQYENDKRHPDSEMLIKLAVFFDVSVDYLLCRDVPDLKWLSIDKQHRIYDLISESLISTNQTAGFALCSSGAKTNFIHRLKHGTISAAPIKDIVLVADSLHIKDEVLSIINEYEPADTLIPDSHKETILNIARDISMKMNGLNREGQEKVLSYVDDLLQSGNYAPPQSTDAAG